MRPISPLCLLAAAISFAQTRPTLTEQELVRRTQLLDDAITSGDPTPWQKFLADDVIIHDEKGAAYSKASFLKTVTPLPTGYSGAIRVVHPQILVAFDTAIFSYDLDEVETVFGNHMTARYHEIDTWLYRNHEWKIAASQVMRYYEDPAALPLPVSLLKQYLGVYELAPGHRMTITLTNGNLFAQRGEAKPTAMLAEAPDLFFRPGVEGRFLFRRNPAGAVNTLVDRRNNEDMLWKRVQ